MRARRGFIAVEDRIVHYRRWGQGPAVLVIHGSPQSSRAVEPAARALAAAGLCAIAPDTPGNGLSTPLSLRTGKAPDSADYARALHALADALGLGRVGLYGFHTGAATACAFAAQDPARTQAVMFDGLPNWTEAERTVLLDGYLPSFTPAWDASHMAWLWARMEEQTVFFPWHTPTPAARMDYDVSPLAALNANAMDFLDAGDAYRDGYRAAFTFRPEPYVKAVAAPCILGVLEGDILRPHLARPPLAGLGAPFVQGVYAAAADLHAAAAAHLSAHPGDPAPPPPPCSQAGFCPDAEGRVLAWRGALVGAGRPLVLLHAAGGSGGALQGVIAAAIRAGRPVIALDLPGHGASGDDWPEAPVTVQAYAQAAADVLAALGVSDVAAAGEGLGALVGAAMMDAAARPQDAARIGDPSFDPADAAKVLSMGAPSLAPEWDGAHLVRAFRIARWERLFRPWFLRERAHARPQDDLDPALVQARAVDLLKAGPRWGQALAAEAAAPPLDLPALDLTRL